MVTAFGDLVRRPPEMRAVALNRASGRTIQSRLATLSVKSVHLSSRVACTERSAQRHDIAGPARRERDALDEGLPGSNSGGLTTISER